MLYRVFFNPVQEDETTTQQSTPMHIVLVELAVLASSIISSVIFLALRAIFGPKLGYPELFQESSDYDILQSNLGKLEMLTTIMSPAIAAIISIVTDLVYIYEGNLNELGVIQPLVTLLILIQSFILFRN